MWVQADHEARVRGACARVWIKRKSLLGESKFVFVKWGEGAAAQDETNVIKACARIVLTLTIPKPSTRLGLLKCRVKVEYIPKRPKGKD